MIKKVFVFLFAVGFILCIMTSAMAYTIMYVYTANGYPLNLRDMPSYSGQIIATIPNGAAVQVNGAYNATWYWVTYNGCTGYAMSRYLVSSYAPYPSGYYSLESAPIPTAEPVTNTNIDIDIDICIRY